MLAHKRKHALYTFDCQNIHYYWQFLFNSHIEIIINLTKGNQSAELKQHKIKYRRVTLYNINNTFHSFYSVYKNTIVPHDLWEVRINIMS